MSLAHCCPAPGRKRGARAPSGGPPRLPTGGGLGIEGLPAAREQPAAGAPLELTAEELSLERADAWLAAAAAGELRQRITLGPRAASAAAGERSRIITYNLFAAYLGTP
ncbi:hypothetical protein [Streptomyces albogriseolus]|uniref:hypothetical protein n=1 Tax=Streptomyces albogriseolus TaxID=1887 RepID=UPI003688166C